MDKAYDRLEWNFLENTLINMGFPLRLVNVIMQCVKIVNFLILINCKATGYFMPHRGIRQGDPLSPYLFILCAEILSSMISHNQDSGKIKGLSIAKNARPITHLLFADDSLMFCSTKDNNIKELHQILEDYQKASGQRINLDKSELMFSKNVDQNQKNNIQRMLGMPIVDKIIKYLGLPTYIRANKKQIFQILAERI